MKKILVVCAAVLLSCSLVHAQEADDTGAGVGLSIIPRLDFSPEFYDGGHTFTLGNSSLYTLFEGNITENLSFSVANHWLGFYDTDDFFSYTKSLYKDSWRSDTTNWLDWANLTWQIGDFSITAGKDAITLGGFEIDQYDWEAHPDMCSSMWNSLPVYQWGLKLGYNINEDNEITFQWTTSPFGERPFSAGLFNYSLGWRGSLWDCVETIWNVTALQQDKGEFLPVVSLGQQFTPSDGLTLGLDLISAIGGEEVPIRKGLSVIPSISWNPTDKIMLFAKAGGEIDTTLKENNKDLMVGLGAYWFPLSDSEDLRLHATASYWKDAKLVTIGVGALYNLNFPRK